MRAPPIAVLLAALAAATPAGAAFEDLGAGARAPGMGNAFVPVADDVYAIFYNPAGLGTLERPQLGTAYASLYPGLSDGSTLGTSFVGYAQPLARGGDGTLAAAWNAFSLNGSLYREDSFYLSYGRRVADWEEEGRLYAGVNGKYLRTSIAAFSEASDGVAANGVVGTGLQDPSLAKRGRGAFDADLGLLYRLGANYAAGLSVTHVDQPNVALSGDDRLPAEVKIGLDYRSLISNLVIELETQRGATGARDEVLATGAERWFPSAFYGDVGARAGFSLGSRELKQASVGVSYRTHRLEADYAMILPLAGVSTAFAAHRLALTLRFGGLAKPEESLELVLQAMKQFKAGQPVDLKIGEGRLTGAEKLTIDEYLGQARFFMNTAKYQEALDAFGKALSIAPANQELLSRYGRLNVVAQMFKELPDYKIDQAQATLHLGALAYFGGNDLEAVRQTAEALRIKPDWKQAQLFLSQLELVTGVKRQLFPPERVDREAAVKLARANAAIEQGDYDTATSLALEVLRGQPSNVAAWEDLGTAYFATRRLDEARDAWRKAYDLEKDADKRKSIRGYLKAIARAQERDRTLRKAPPSVTRPPMSPEREYQLFNEALEDYTKRRFERAKLLLEEILDADPGNVEAQKALKRVNSELE